jgi:N utilization substance protein B
MSDFGASRHASRERALEILYEADRKVRSVDEILAAMPIEPDEYCRYLVHETSANKDKAERLISQFAVDWPLDRMAVIDRLVMTMSIAELCGDNAPPRAVVLDEAVELAKVYSTESSGSFVNGVLTAVADELGV